MKAYISAPLVGIAVAVMLGIVVGDAFSIAHVYGLIAMAVVLVPTILTLRLPLTSTLLLHLFFFLFGLTLLSYHRQSLQYADDQQMYTYQMVIASEMVEKPKTLACDLLLTDNGRKVRGYIWKSEQSRQLQVGDGLVVQTRIAMPTDQGRNGFDYGRYLTVNGYSGQCFIRTWHTEALPLNGLSRFQKTRLWFLEKRHSVLQKLRQWGATSDVYGVLAAMTLGDKSALSREVKDTYADTGASHILALSGLHLGIIYALLSLLLPVRRFRLVSQVLLVLGIWCFAFLSGLSPSVTRAATMLSIYALLSLAHRDQMSVNALAFSALLLLTANPYALFNVSFQLSYMAVLSILLMMPLLYNNKVTIRFLQRHPILKWLWGIVAVSFSAQIGVLPLLVYHFGQVSVWFMVTNLVVMPATTFILYGTVLLLVLPFAPIAQALFAIVGGLNTVLEWLQKWPLASIDGLHATVLQVAMYYLLVWILFISIPTILGCRSDWRQPSRV